MSLLVFLLWKFVKSQTVCLSGANNVRGWINGDFKSIDNFNGYPAYYQNLTNDPQNDGCVYSDVYIYSRFIFFIFAVIIMWL